MKPLKLTYDLSGFQTGTPVPPLVARVFDREMSQVGEVVLSQEQPVQDVEVEKAGEYFIRVVQPSGRSFGFGTTVTEGKDKPVPVRPSRQASPHESLAYQNALGALPRFPRKEEEWESELSGENRKMWVRLWEQAAPAKWVTRPWTDDPPTIAPDHASLRLKGTPQVLRCLQCGGEDIPWRLVALPPAGDTIQAVLSWSPRSSSSATAEEPAKARGTGATPLDLDLVLTTSNTALEALLRSLRGPSLDLSERLMEYARSRPELAQDLLQGKVTDPVAAAVGGYSLLRTGGLDPLAGAAENLANGFPWLPDGAIIHGWLLLSARATPNYPRARERFLEAVRRGIPVFTEGLRLLRDGLTYFARIHDSEKDTPSRGPKDSEAGKALDTVSHYAAAARWTAPHTTFYGTDPAGPSTTAPSGMLSDRKDVREFTMALVGRLRPLVAEPG